jgi:predicted transcriptional regulator
MIPQTNFVRHRQTMNFEDIRWKIRELAVQSRVTVGELLREAGVSTATVWRWEKGQTKPRLSSIAKINQAADRLRGRV